jgi:uncharacterized protein YjiK/methionine-rich copper-binding protein CopC
MKNLSPQTVKLLAPTLLALALAACGGGGGSSNQSIAFSTPTLAFTAPGSTYDLANYSQTGNFTLPAVAEASGITYDKDTDKLFAIGDGAGSIVQIDKQGNAINSMTLSQAVIDFKDADTEGIAYVGKDGSNNPILAIVEERARIVDLFTYVAGGTLTRLQAQSVALGTNVGNIGLEGLTFDPSTGDYIFVKEKFPEQVFRTTLNFASNASSNGVPGTEPTNNLFDPSKTGLSALNDVFALSNVLPSTAPDYNNLLIVGAASGQVVKMDRAGNIVSTLPMDATAQNEGVTMGADGTIYAVGEHAGPGGVTGLTVYSPTTAKTAVGAGSNLYVTVNQPVHAGSGNVIISNGTDVRTIPVTDTQQVSFSGNTVKVNPRVDFAGGTTYGITFAAGVFKNAAGADAPALADPTVLSFTVRGTPDTSAPTLVASAPASNATNVSISRIALTFSEAMQPGTGNIVITGADGDTRTIPVNDSQVKFLANTMRVTLTTALHSNVVYTVQLNSGVVTDLSGNAFAGITESFTTGVVGGPPPTLLITEVNSSATGGDFFELYNYGSTAIDISNWRWGDDHLDFSIGANTAVFPANTIINAGERLIVVNTTNEAAFRTAWNNLSNTTKVVALGGAGLGGGDIVIVYDSSGTTVTWFNYEGNTPAPFLSPEDGVVLTPAVASAGVTSTFPNHAGLAFGGSSKSSAVWDGVSSTSLTYRTAAVGVLGGFAQTGDATAIGSPGQ